MMRGAAPPYFLDWAGATGVVLASGPSLERADVEQIRSLHAAGDVRVIAINTTAYLAPWADVIFGADVTWWDRQAELIGDSEAPSGKLWTSSVTAARRHRLHLARVVTAPGLSRLRGVLHHGGNGGYQAIGLAQQFGASRIILLGFDMQHTDGRAHWHADHPRPLRNAPSVAAWAPAFIQLAHDLAAEGVEVINCTRQTALTCFPRLTLREAFEGHL